MPVEALVAVTYRCNSRCVMCNIWQEKPGVEVPASFYERLPSTLRNINLTGGEPFLRKDLPEIVEVIKKRCHDPRMVINSNGFMPELIEKAAKKIISISGKTGIRVSLDGIGEAHDKTRGVPGAFDRSVRTLKLLKGAGVKDLGIAFTAVGGNVSEMEKVYALSKELGVEFTVAVAHSSEVYFKADNTGNKIDPGALREQFGRLVKSELRGLHPKRWYRAYFEWGLYNYALGKGRLIDCKALGDFFYLDPKGDIYPCNVLNRPLGNLVEQDFDTLWNSPEALATRRVVSSCPYNCWMVCTVAPEMRKNPLKPLGWILPNKIKAHFGGGVI